MMIVLLILYLLEKVFIIMSVKVAVRVRPFNEREKFLGCICCVEMKDSTTVLYENKEKNKKQHYFTFDHSFWSHDQYEVRTDGYMVPVNSKYIDQGRLYNIIGKEMLQNSWQGYNCCLFAYGQTGAGKSYSMLGYGANRGIIPMVCEEIFYKMRKHQQKGAKEYEITLSMLEIYNEKVQDLFVPTSKRPQNGLKIRENKTLGVYVEGLTKYEVLSYADIERRMEEGNRHRSLASTLMNEYSSRAHTIVMIQFIQKEWINKAKMNKKSSFINLVDLAGSERVSKTGIVDNKDRLKEASNINKSLHTLGRVIETLADQASGRAKSAQVPYRDSALTRILQSALGGNSKTIMICAISPANDNYEETLSTLRYADQTKKIKNKPIVNESAVDKIIRELRQENERLKKMLQTSEQNSLSNSRTYTDSEKKQMRSNVRASMRQVEREIKKNLKSFAINTDEIQEEEQSLMMTEFIDLQEPSQFFSELSFDWGNKAQVYITNLNQDELLNYKVRYSCEKDLLITNKNNKKNARGMENYAKIVLCGLGIEENHAKIIKYGDKYFIEALSDSAAQYTLVNGKPVSERRELKHNDRIILGINSVFLFKNNLKKCQDKGDKLDYEYAINERQAEMQNLSLIPPSTLSLFLPSSLLKDSRTKDIYSGPPTQALNATKKLLAPQQNETDVLNKIEQIQNQFNRLVKQNEQKLKEKEDFYKSRLSQLRKEKDQERNQKNTLSEKLMAKSLESEALKSKNAELEQLKKKLSKYYDEKNKRNKVRQSMLLQNEENRIEQDIEYVQVQNPHQARQSSSQYGVGDSQIAQSYKRKQRKTKNQKKDPLYQELVIQEYDDNEDLLKSSLEPRERADSLLITDIVEEVTGDKKRKLQASSKKKLQDQIRENQLQLLKMQDLLAKVLTFQFRRLYNIKICCEVEQEIICSNCQKKMPQAQQQEETPRRLASLLGIQSFIENQQYPDAELEELHFKQPQEKKKERIKEEQLVKLQQELRELEQKLIVRQARLSMANDKNEDEMLLNYSIDGPIKSSVNPIESISDRRSSFSIRKFSADSEFQLNLTQQPKGIELKKAVGQFIQILADLPELRIIQAESLLIKPKEKNLLISNSLNIDIQPQQAQKLNFSKLQQLQFTFFSKPTLFKKESNQSEEMLMQEVQVEEVKSLKEEIVTFQMGINTEFDFSQEKLKGNSFTAFLNDEMEQTNQNQTEILNDQKKKQQNQVADSGTNTDEEKILAVDEQKIKVHLSEVGISTEEKNMIDCEMVTDINIQTWQDFSKENDQEENDVENYIQQKKNQQQENEIQCYLSSQGETFKKIEKQTRDMETTTLQLPKISISVNTNKFSFLCCKQVDIKLEGQQPSSQAVEQEIEQYVHERDEEDEIELYLETNKEQQKEVISRSINTSLRLEISSNQVQVKIEKEDQLSPIKIFTLSSSHSLAINHEVKNKMIISSQSINLCVFPQKNFEKIEEEPKQDLELHNFERNKPEMIDEEVQFNSSIFKKDVDDEVQEQKRNDQSFHEKEERRKNKLTTIENHLKDFGNIHQMADLSMSEIQKHELSYQDVSVFGFDGLLREDELNNKIKQLQDKIKQLESQSPVKELSSGQKIVEKEKSSKQITTKLQASETEREYNKLEEKDEKFPVSPPMKKPLKKKKKKHQMNEEQRKQYQIQKELQAKIIQCNNQNIINERNLQIHKRKREADELRKILIKREKVELQKQLLVLIPMIRRFNLIAREMKRLIEAKINIEYRNFSHFQMVEILKSYSVNKKSTGENIQIQITIMNLEEGRIYIWPTQVFQNRYEIAEQVFQQYASVEDDEIGRNRMFQDRAQKSKDPFWDPVDFVNHGHGYLSMEFLLYNLSFEGYISIVYKSQIVAKLFVSLTPVKVKKYRQDDDNQNSVEESELDHIQIGNQRNLLEKDAYFTLSIESIKFMKAEERHKNDESTSHNNINTLNSNILKYSVSYQLLENQYKTVTFTTPEVDFVEEKQFKRIDYMRRHSFKNISESTLAYLSDCPIKFTLNVMKDYNEECLNASFNSELSDSEPSSSDLNTSQYSDNKSVVSKKSSVVISDLPQEQQPKSDFSKKPKANLIYQNTQMITKLQTEAKKEQEKIDKIRKMQQAKRKASRYDKEKGKDKDKDCVVY